MAADRREVSILVVLEAVLGVGLFLLGLAIIDVSILVVLEAVLGAIPVVFAISFTSVSILVVLEAVLGAVFVLNLMWACSEFQSLLFWKPFWEKLIILPWHNRIKFQSLLFWKPFWEIGKVPLSNTIYNVSILVVLEAVLGDTMKAILT